MKELDYLRGLCSKYGTFYIRKYFGFTFREIAKYCGMSESCFSGAMNGRWDIPKKYQDRFIEAFTHFKIEERTKNYQETESQKATKELTQKVKDMLTSLVIFGILLT